jgi:hypothetical protein
MNQDGVWAYAVHMDAGLVDGDLETIAFGNKLSGVTNMRTPLFLLVGFLLLAASALLGKLFSSNYPGATYAATWTFVVLWLVISGANMWVGVAKAGYSLKEELPIFLLIFSVPTVVALFLKWRII